jgi:hypothetical protein
LSAFVLSRRSPLVSPPVHKRSIHRTELIAMSATGGHSQTQTDLDSILDAALDEFDAPTAHPAARSSPPASLTRNDATSTAVGAASVPAASTTPVIDGGAVPSLSPETLATDPAAMAAFQALLQAMAGQDTSAAAPSAAGEEKTPQMEEMTRELNAMMTQMAQMQQQSASGAAAPAFPSTAATPSALISSPASASSSAADPINDAIRMIAEGANNLPAGGSGAPDDAQMEKLLNLLLAEMKVDGAEGGQPAAPGANMDQMEGMSREKGKHLQIAVRSVFAIEK